MKNSSLETNRGDYVLATGESAGYRLRLLKSIYGTGAHELVKRAGIKLGMRVADIGCGVGMVTQLLGEMVGPDGEVVGIDFSGAQIAQARNLLPANVSNVSFVKASATSTNLPGESFDLVYCRFLLIHLTEPDMALREMYRLLKPNGILVCEDGDLTSAGARAPSKVRGVSLFFFLLPPWRAPIPKKKKKNANFRVWFVSPPRGHPAAQHMSEFAV